MGVILLLVLIAAEIFFMVFNIVTKKSHSREKILFAYVSFPFWLFY
jgi:hypothetical protein